MPVAMQQLCLPGVQTAKGWGKNPFGAHAALQLPPTVLSARSLRASRMLRPPGKAETSLPSKACVSARWSQNQEQAPAAPHTGRADPCLQAVPLKRQQRKTRVTCVSQASHMPTSEMKHDFGIFWQALCHIRCPSPPKGELTYAQKQRRW